MSAFHSTPIESYVMMEIDLSTRNPKSLSEGKV